MGQEKSIVEYSWPDTREKEKLRRVQKVEFHGYQDRRKSKNVASGKREKETRKRKKGVGNKKEYLRDKGQGL